MEDMKNFVAKSGVIISRLLIGAVLVFMPPYTVSSSQQVLPEASSAGGVTLNAEVTFIQAAYVAITFQILKTTGIYDLIETDEAVATNYTLVQKSSLSIKGLADETSVMTCNIESGSYKAQKSEKTLDCSGSRQITAHAFMGEKRFEDEVDVSSELLARLQSTDESHIAIDVTYI